MYGKVKCASCQQTHEATVRAAIDRREVEPDDEPTEEELEAIIAEQRQCLPAWWTL